MTKIKLRESFRPFAPAVLEEFSNNILIGYRLTVYAECCKSQTDSKRSGSFCCACG